MFELSVSYKHVSVSQQTFLGSGRATLVNAHDAILDRPNSVDVHSVGSSRETAVNQLCSCIFQNSIVSCDQASRISRRSIRTPARPRRRAARHTWHGASQHSQAGPRASGAALDCWLGSDRRASRISGSSAWAGSRCRMYRIEKVGFPQVASWDRSEIGDLTGVHPRRQA